MFFLQYLDLYLWNIQFPKKNGFPENKFISPERTNWIPEKKDFPSKKINFPNKNKLSWEKKLISPDFFFKREKMDCLNFLWQFLTKFTISDNFENFCQLRQFLKTLTISDNFYNSDNFDNFWQLQQSLRLVTFETLITILTIENLKCLDKEFGVSLFHYPRWSRGVLKHQGWGPT